MSRTDTRRTAVKTHTTGTVYHYCSVESFYSILHNKMLRLSDIGKSNDYMERRWLQLFILETAMEEYEKEPFPIAFQKDGTAYSGRGAVEELIRYELKTMGQHWYDDYITYAICFSEKGDVLSQWRGYADDGQGVCIGFRADRISGMLKKNRETGRVDRMFEFARIRYTKAAQKALIRPYIRRLFRYLHTLTGQDGEPSGELIRLLRAVNGESAFCKNPAFSEEREWRLAVNFPIPTTDAYQKFMERQGHVSQNELFSKLKTVVVGKTIKSYVELNLKTLGLDAVTSVRLGPKCRLTKNDVKLFLFSEGVALEGENILTSSATYR